MGYSRDMLEIFAQKYEEMGLSVNGGQSFSELFFYIPELSSNEDSAVPDDEFTKAIIELIKKMPELKDLIGEMLPIKNEKLLEKLEKMAKEEYNTVTIADYESHIKKLEGLLDDYYKVILIGHSQGTLFVNHVYNGVVLDEDASRYNMKDYVLPYYIAPVAAPGTLHLYSGFKDMAFAHRSHTGNTYYLKGYNMYAGDGIYAEDATYTEKDKVITDVRYILSSNDTVISFLGKALNTPPPNEDGEGGRRL